ncbi:hypothetical protein, partial [Streptosporangium canum]|uniref:hypothetical protein n=1 Tax=Streptosporangium canum TaxID=324952 RepID=UPI0037A90DB9
PGGQATQVKKKVRIPGHPGGQATQVKKKVRIPGHPGGQATQVKKKVRIPGHPGGQATQVKKKVRIPGHPGGQATQVKKKVRIPGHPGGQATQVKKKVRIPGHPGGMQKPEVLGATVKASDDNQTKMTGKEKIATQSSGYAAKKKAAKKKKQILKEKKKNKKKKEKKRDATPAGQVQNIISCATGRVGLGDTLVAQVYTYTKKGYDTVRIAKLLYKNPTPAQRRKALEIMTALESCKKVSDVLAAAVEGAEDIVIPSEHSKEERIKVKDPWFVGGSKDRN